MSEQTHSLTVILQPPKLVVFLGLLHDLSQAVIGHCNKVWSWGGGKGDFSFVLIEFEVPSLDNILIDTIISFLQ